MATNPLDDFFMHKSPEEQKEHYVPSTQPVFPNNLSPSYFVSATYDGKKKVFLLKLYEPISKKIFFWSDKTGHKPYCLTNLKSNELKRIDRLMRHPGFERFETVEKFDALLDKNVSLTKIIAKDPLAIGGVPRNSIRDIIPVESKKILGIEGYAKVWEAYIKYYQSYIYDQNLDPGMIYAIKDGNLIEFSQNLQEVSKKISELFKKEPKNLRKYIDAWARLLECPVPKFRRVALDIEVFSPIATRVPDPNEAAYRITAVSLFGSDGKKRILLLKREGVKEGDTSLPRDLIVEYYDSENNLISEVFKALWDYPFVLTFNGDDFDLKYLWRRALNMGFKRDEIPIEASRRVCLLKYGVHLDLYKFFFNRSIQIYAFSKKYRGFTLADIGEALIGMPKLKLSKPISDLSYSQLARYCARDAEITLGLTTFDNDLVMKLILVLARISHMPMEDVSRQGVSRWILNFLYCEHRRRGMLIPNRDDILAVKGITATKAVIKGKKYKGAIVVDPLPGVHFNIAVMDFSSLYPSIIKVHNLGYRSILCSHEDCKGNIVPDTPHWICKKQKALESLLVGSLRDLRVKWYKPKSRDKSLNRDQRNWYNVIQSALKVILNASYGVFGAETFNLYCPPVAEATAAYGRHAITQTIKKARELKITSLYGDTDSVFLKNPSSEQITAIISWSERSLGMELDLEKSYRYVVLSSRKKNYLGVFPDGNIEIKGMTGKKIHIPFFLKETFSKIVERLGKVQSPTEFEEAKAEIRKIIRECYVKLERREYAIEKLAFHVVLGKALRGYTKTTPQHVKAARLLQESGREIKPGDTISYVKTTRSPNVKPVEFASKSEVDVDSYVKYLRSTFDQILDPLGLDFDDIIGLTKLERWI